jgi:hypothetical protein
MVEGDIGAWLRDLGLGQYEEAFRENAIDADVLARLTADDLKDLGSQHSIVEPPTLPALLRSRLPRRMRRRWRSVGSLR